MVQTEYLIVSAGLVTMGLVFYDLLLQVSTSILSFSFFN
jgi:hypothetical protein